LLSVADLSAILLVLPPGVTPISARIFELLHYGVRYQESGVCLILSMFSVIGAASIYFLSVRPVLSQGIISRDLPSPIESSQ
jgi:ABC-type Fe3+ transport system permease subunit